MAKYKVGDIAFIGPHEVKILRVMGRNGYRVLFTKTREDDKYADVKHNFARGERLIGLGVLKDTKCSRQSRVKGNR